MLIELAEPFAIEGTISWSEETTCGIQFARPIDCAALLSAQAERKRDDRRGGALRLATMQRGTSYGENGVRAIKVTNVSHRGMGLAHDGSLRTGMLLRLIVESGIEREGMVRWSRGGRAGVSLMEPLTRGELERVGYDHLANHRAPSSAFFGPGDGAEGGEAGHGAGPLAHQPAAPENETSVWRLAESALL